MTPTRQITLKWLDGPDLAALEPILFSLGAMSLNHDTSRAIVAYDGDRIVGFFVMQLIPHLEPLYVDPEFRSSSVAVILVEGMVQFMKDVNCRGAMLVAEHPGVAKIAEHFGMERITYPLYSKINMGDGI